MLWRKAMGAFRTVFFVAVLAVGCGGRAAYDGGGSNSAGTGSASGGSATAGAVSGSSGAVSGESAGATSGVVATGTANGSGSAGGAGTGSSSSSGGSPACPVCPTGATCVDGTCSCPTGWTACEDGAGLTACVTAQTVRSDPSNCGHCGIQCPASAPTCQNGSCQAPPSCATGGPGMTNCGPGGGGTESCCTSLEVTGGTYYRTYDGVASFDAFGETPPTPNVTADGGPTDESDPATVSSFRLDKYDVTVGRFRQFVTAVLPQDGGVGWLPSPGSGKHSYLNGDLGLVNVVNDAGVSYEPGWVATDDSNIAPTSANLACSTGTTNYATWTPSAGPNESLPINCVNWYEAYAFCIWDGGFFPSEAEWEYAAAGGSQQREYPWGSAAPGTANQYAIYGGYYPSGVTGSCTGVANIAPVGTATLGAGLWGQLDLAGDVWEWNLDWYAAYAACTDCAAFTAASSRVIRGGAFVYDDASLLLPPYRGSYPPAQRNVNVGFRCSRTP